MIWPWEKNTLNPHVQRPKLPAPQAVPAPAPSSGPNGSGPNGAAPATNGTVATTVAVAPWTGLSRLAIHRRFRYNVPVCLMCMYYVYINIYIYFKTIYIYIYMIIHIITYIYIYIYIMGEHCIRPILSDSCFFFHEYLPNHGNLAYWRLVHGLVITNSPNCGFEF